VRSPSSDIRLPTSDCRHLTACHGVPYLSGVDVPFAIGAGSDYALGAMDYGASPEEAVRGACRRNVFTGGEIQVVNIAAALGLQPQAAALAEAAE